MMSTIPNLNIPTLLTTDLPNPTITVPDKLIDHSLDLSHGEMWRVIIHNDPITTFEYVIHILGDLFMLSSEIAEHVAVTAHENGEAVVVIRPKEEALRLTKVAVSRARTDGYPLTFSAEPD